MREPALEPERAAEERHAVRDVLDAEDGAAGDHAASRAS
jgi:hypothetical protein